MVKKQSPEEQMHMALRAGTIYKAAAFLILLGLLIGAYNANQSYAWFTDRQEGNYELISGKVHYQLEITTEPGLMVPGVDLVKDLKLTNLSTIDTDVRMKLEYTVWTSSGAIDTATSTTAVYVTNASIGGAANANAGPEQYLNLAGGAADSQLAPVVLGSGASMETWWANATTVAAVAYDAGTGAATPEAIALPFASVSYDGPKTTNIFAGREVILRITLQAKQREHVEWSEITVYERFEDAGV